MDTRRSGLRSFYEQNQLIYVFWVHTLTPGCRAEIKRPFWFWFPESEVFVSFNCGRPSRSSHIGEPELTRDTGNDSTVKTSFI